MTTPGCRAAFLASLLLAAGLAVAVVIGRAVDHTTAILAGYICGVVVTAASAVVVNWRRY
jgi:hypothetical protein